MSQTINQFNAKLSNNDEIIGNNYINDDNNEEKINELKNENDNLKKQIEQLKMENKNIKEEKNKEIKKNKVLSQSANSANSDEEEEFDVNYLANTVKKKNNSEDMKIDFPGLSDINEKYNDLKNKVMEIKEIFKVIKSKCQSKEPDMELKINRVSDLLDINFD